MSITLDEYVSPEFLAHHARIDQYQTYSLILDDLIANTTQEHWEPGLSYANESEFRPDGTNNPRYGLPGNPAAYRTENGTALVESTSVIAYETFTPTGKIPFDFGALAIAYPVRKGDSRSYHRRISVFDGTTGTLRYIYQWDESLNGQSRGWSTSIEGGPSYRDLISGWRDDPRQLPTYLEGVAGSERTITYAYYRKNHLEDHPRVSASLDWLQYSQRVKAGDRYRLRIDRPVLGTLLTDSQTLGELEDRPGDYPKAYLPIGAPLAELFTLWELTAAAPVTTGIVGLQDPPGTYDSIYGWDVDSTIHLYNRVRTEYQPLPRILAATNNWWGHGTVTTSRNPPAATHPALSCDEFALFYEPNADGSIGQLTMDSPRLKEIHAALGAADYATDPETGLARVVNLGWMIDRLTKWAGIRRKPNGGFLSAAEAKKYQRSRLNKPSWPAGQYSEGEWAERGLAIPYLPTTYQNGQRQDNQYDLVHDLPQLLQAYHDQIDASLGVQHNGEIRIPVGGKVQSYTNQGAMLIDMAMRVMEVLSIAERLLVMVTETANSVRELFAGIGIPITTKSISIQIGGKVQRIYYPAFQSGKGSILDRLTALAQNTGIVLGALMPRAGNQDDRLNPFRRKPKG